MDETIASLLRSRHIGGVLAHASKRSVGWLAWREKWFVMAFPLDDSAAIRAPGLAHTQVVTDVADMPESLLLGSARRLVARGGFVVIAHLDGVDGPVGYTEGQKGVFVDTDAPDSVVYAQYIWVHPEHRGKRIADDLRSAFNTHSRSIGAEVVLVQVAAQNGASRRSTLRSEQSRVVGHIVRWSALGGRLASARTTGYVTELVGRTPAEPAPAPLLRATA